MSNIKYFRLFSNDNEKSKAVEEKVREKLVKNHLIEDKENYDLAIAIGGDGSFLRMVKANNFNSNTIYVGVNAGTLGFAQEVSIEEIDDFIIELKNGDYKVDSIGVQETKVVTKNDAFTFYSLNEIVLR